MADTWIHTDNISGYVSTSDYETYCFAAPWVADQSQSCDRIGFYCWADSGNDVNVRLGIYDSSFNLLAEGTAAFVVDSVGWKDLTLDSPVSIVDTNTYYLASISDKAPTVGFRYRHTTPPDGGSSYENGITYPTFPDPLTDGGPSGNRYAAMRLGYADVDVEIQQVKKSVTVTPKGSYGHVLAAWLDTWKYRVVGFVVNDNLDSNLTHYGLKVKISASCGKNRTDLTAIFDEISSSSKKWALTKADGTTQLYAEIEGWDDSGEIAEIWVSKSDWTLSSTTYTKIYLYFDSAQSDNTTYIGDTKGSTPASNVWDSDYKAVLHSDETSGTAVDDSSSNGNDGVYTGALQDSAGCVDGCHGYDGVDDNVDMGDQNGGDLDVAGVDFCWEICLKPDSFATGTWSRLIAYRDDDTNFFQLVGNGDNDSLIAYCEKADTIYRIRYDDFLSDYPNQFVDVLMSFNNSTNTVKLYVNGVDATDASDDACAAGDDTHFYFGIRQITEGMYDGLFDEMRVSTGTTRSAAWAKANYYNHADNLIIWGQIEEYVGDVEITQVMKSIDITAQTHKVAIDILTNQIKEAVDVTDKTQAVLIDEAITQVKESVNITDKTQSVLLDEAISQNKESVDITGKTNFPLLDEAITQVKESVEVDSKTNWPAVDVSIFQACTPPTRCSGAPCPDFSGWLFSGLNLNNSDNGKLYITVSYAASTQTISIYRDAAKLNLVAQGTSAWDIASICEGFWKHEDDEADTVVEDFSGNNRDGTASENTSGLNTTGKINDAFEFGDYGTEKYWTSNDAAFKRTDEFTVAAWLYPMAAPDLEGRTILSQYNYHAVGNDTGWNLGRRSGDSDRFTFSVDEDGVYAAAEYNGFWSEYLNKWVFVTAVFSASKYLKLYINGVIKDIDVDIIPASITYEKQFSVGIRANLSYSECEGKIDNVQYFNKELTETEIEGLYNEASGTDSLSGLLSSGTITLIEQNSSGLSGAVSWDGTQSNGNIELLHHKIIDVTSKTQAILIDESTIQNKEAVEVNPKTSWPAIDQLTTQVKESIDVTGKTHWPAIDILTTQVKESIDVTGKTHWPAIDILTTQVKESADVTAQSHKVAIDILTNQVKETIDVTAKAQSVIVGTVTLQNKDAIQVTGKTHSVIIGEAVSQSKQTVDVLAKVQSVLLDESISQVKQSVEVDPKTHAILLDVSIPQVKESVEVTPKTHSILLDEAITQIKKSVAVTSKTNVALLDEAISQVKISVDVTGKVHKAAIDEIINQLKTAVEVSAKTQSVLLDESISQSKQAVEVTGKTHWPAIDQLITQVKESVDVTAKTHKIAIDELINQVKQSVEVNPKTHTVTTDILTTQIKQAIEADAKTHTVQISEDVEIQQVKESIDVTAKTHWPAIDILTNQIKTAVEATGKTHAVAIDEITNQIKTAIEVTAKTQAVTIDEIVNQIKQSVDVIAKIQGVAIDQLINQVKESVEITPKTHGVAIDQLITQNKSAIIVTAKTHYVTIDEITNQIKKSIEVTPKTHSILLDEAITQSLQSVQAGAKSHHIAIDQLINQVKHAVEITAKTHSVVITENIITNQVLKHIEAAAKSHDVVLNIVTKQVKISVDVKAKTHVFYVIGGIVFIIGKGLRTMNRKVIFDFDFPQNFLPVVEINTMSTAEGDITIDNESVEDITTLTAKVYEVDPPDSEHNNWTGKGVDLYGATVLDLTSKKLSNGKNIVHYSFDPSAIAGIADEDYIGILILVNAADDAAIPQAGIELIMKIDNKISEPA